MAAVDIREMRLDEALAVAAVGVLGTAMVDNPIHVAVFQGAGLEQRDHLTTMFTAKLIDLPGEMFLAEQEGALVGVLRSYSCGAAFLKTINPNPTSECGTGSRCGTVTIPRRRIATWARWGCYLPHRARASEAG